MTFLFEPFVVVIVAWLLSGLPTWASLKFGCGLCVLNSSTDAKPCSTAGSAEINRLPLPSIYLDVTS